MDKVVILRLVNQRTEPIPTINRVVATRPNKVATLLSKVATHRSKEVILRNRVAILHSKEAILAVIMVGLPWGMVPVVSCITTNDSIRSCSNTRSTLSSLPASRHSPPSRSSFSAMTRAA